MTAFYNEINPHAAEWLRRLIAGGHIAPGIVDTRSIEDIAPDELREFTQVHLFAGIGIWSLALRNAGWPDDRPVWTGSCPCQPFSIAGEGKGLADERHLWPAMHWLVAECRPTVIFGEQVASDAGLNWLDIVSADLEGSGYATAAADLCAAGVGAPHIRQRLFWMANANDPRRQGWLSGRPDQEWEVEHRHAGCRSPAMAGRVADADLRGTVERPQSRIAGQTAGETAGDRQNVAVSGEPCRTGGDVCHATRGFWSDAEWLPFKDGKWRPVKPGISPVADGTPRRVALLRAYGNAIVAPLATEFVRAAMDIIP